MFFISVISTHAAVPPPSNFQASVRSACAIDFSWDAASSAPDYYEIRSTSSQSFFGGLGDIVATSTGVSYTQTGLAPGTSLLYRIRATQGTNFSIWAYPPANPVSTSQATTPPNPPSTLTGLARDSGGLIEINWQGQGSSISQYGGIEIQRALWSKSYTSSSTEILQKDTSFYSDNGLTLFGSINQTKAYKYRLRNFENDYGCSIPNTYSSYTDDLVVPPQPKNLTTSYVYNPTNPPITLSWNPSEATTYYNVYQSTSTNPFVKVGQQPDTSFSANNPELNQTYNYYVVACSVNNTNIGCSASSTPVSVSVTNAPQRFQSRILHSDESGIDIHLSFKNTFSNSTPNYDIYRKTQGNFNPSNKIDSVGGSSDTNYIFESYDINAPLGKTYTYGVRANFGGQKSDFSTLDVNTDIDKVLQGAGWSGYSYDGTTPVGAGWLVFNSDFIDQNKTKTNYSPNAKFSVQIDKSGLFSGLAWASAQSSGTDDRGWGWVSFNQEDLIGCPDNPTATTVSSACSAKLVNGEVLGWARFLAANKPTSPFSGWISLNSKTVSGTQRTAFTGSKEVAVSYLTKKIIQAPSSYTLSGIWNKVFDTARSIAEITKIYTTDAAGSVVYGVTYDDTKGTFSGEAWGGDSFIGWISFGGASCPNCNVSITKQNNEPVVSNVQVTEATLSEVGETNRSGPVWCATTPAYKVTWNYNDQDGDDTNSTQIIFKTPNGQTLTSVTDNSLISSGGQGIYFLSDPIGKLGSKQNFKASVIAQDVRGAYSQEAQSSTKQTPQHYYPLVDFTWDPNPMTLNVPTTFDGSSTQDRSGGVWPIQTWSWLFIGGTPETATTQIATSTFFTASNSPVTLTVKDSNNNSCSIDQNASETAVGSKRIFKER